MTTPDLLNALADLCDALGAFRDRIDHRGIIPPNIVAAGDAVSIALGLLPEATWQETAAALRTHATLTPGLPEGWEWVEGSTTEAQSVSGYYGIHVVCDTVYIDGEAPVDVVRAVLARAGVGS